MNGQIEALLREEDPGRLENLWRRADEVRRAQVGDEVHLRGLVELSNHCQRSCTYCGLRAPNRCLERYRLSAAEVLACASQAVRLGYGTLVIQAGEDPGIEARWLTEVIRAVKAITPLAITLSLGEREDAELREWRSAGADRYLLRFETSNPELYRRIHPSRPGRLSDRVAILGRLRDMGYAIGSGVMVGIPGQSYADLARDIELFAELDLDMIGVGPYLAHPDTPLANDPGLADGVQVPASESMTCKTVALARLVCPRANIPATTALATIDGRSGRELGLRRGANVWMPNLTPQCYRALYQIYPAKAGVRDEAETHHGQLMAVLARLGRSPGRGRGDAALAVQPSSEQVEHDHGSTRAAGGYRWYVQ